jgi:hypothetical protein
VTQTRTLRLWRRHPPSSTGEISAPSRRRASRLMAWLHGETSAPGCPHDRDVLVPSTRSLRSRVWPSALTGLCASRIAGIRGISGEIEGVQIAGRGVFTGCRCSIRSKSRSSCRPKRSRVSADSHPELSTARSPGASYEQRDCAAGYELTWSMSRSGSSAIWSNPCRL